MTKLILSTGNIVSGGPSIIRKPGTYRSNLELTNSLRSNFLAAQEFYGAAAAQEAARSGANGNGNGIGSGSGNGSTARIAAGRWQPASVWTSLEREEEGSGDEAEGVGGGRGGEVMYIPRIDWESASGLQEEAARYDITAKLFFLPTAPSGQEHRRRYAREALTLVLRELAVAAVDLLIVSLPGISFEGDCEWEADRANAQQGDADDEATTWAVAEELHRRGQAKRLGVAEFGSEKLARLLRRAAIRPAVDQINVKNCCNVPPPLVKLARDEGIELLTHSDCTDILPPGTLRDLLGRGLQGAGILASLEDGGDDDDDDATAVGEGLRGDLTPQWVIKYTAVVRDRGVIENKGYFAGAELTSA